MCGVVWCVVKTACLHTILPLQVLGSHECCSRQARCSCYPATGCPAADWRTVLVSTGSARERRRRQCCRMAPWARHILRAPTLVCIFVTAFTASRASDRLRRAQRSNVDCAPGTAPTISSLPAVRPARALHSSGLPSLTQCEARGPLGSWRAAHAALRIPMARSLLRETRWLPLLTPIPTMLARAAAASLCAAGTALCWVRARSYAAGMLAAVVALQ